MRSRILRKCVASGTALLTSFLSTVVSALPEFAPQDVFELEWVANMDVAGDGRSIIYLRSGFDVMTDQTRNSLWLIDADGSNGMPLLTDVGRIAEAVFSPDGSRIAFAATRDGMTRLQMLWRATGAVTDVAQLTQAPRALAFSPDGARIAFLMRVPAKESPLVTPLEAPKGANWAPPAKVIDRLLYRSDGGGFRERGEAQLFVVDAAGGTPRRLTAGDHPHSGPLAWSKDGTFIVVAGNHRDDWEYYAEDTELFRVDTATGEAVALTDRRGPDSAPTLSADGRTLAYLGYDDDHRANIHANVYVMDLQSRVSRRLSPDLPGSVDAVQWARDGKRLFVQYDAEGDTRIASVNLSGRVTDHIEGVGGLDLSRPYAAGTFDVGGDTIAFTKGTGVRPADLAVWRGRGVARQITALNEDLLANRAIGTPEEIWFDSPADKRRIQAWIVKPPAFDATRKYPLILEIHGGPHTNYGARFAAEIQLYAAAGYVVVYANPRGSTSYGEAFANLIDKNYPNEDYDDLMGAVDAVIARGYVDERNLFVTGGSGGGILTAWIVGKTNRFRAAASAKPVINWASMALTSDIGEYINDHWFEGAPWLHMAEYARRSPLSLVGNVETPTMLITGEDDYRTPMSESEQYYQALKIRRIDTVLVRVPGASHDISARPSQLATKVAHILAWFERYRIKSD